MNIKIKIKREIIKIVNQYYDRALTGFLQLPELKDIAKGELDWFMVTKKGENSNILMLANVNKECIESFLELSNEGIIKILRTSPYVSMMDGEVYTYPIAEKIMVYKKTRWMPMVVTKGPNFKES